LFLLSVKLTNSIDIGDGGAQNSRKKYFFSGNYILRKIRAFSGKNHVKFRDFADFSCIYHKNSGILLIFHTYFSGKNVLFL